MCFYLIINLPETVCHVFCISYCQARKNIQLSHNLGSLGNPDARVLSHHIPVNKVQSITVTDLINTYRVYSTWLMITVAFWMAHGV